MKKYLLLLLILFPAVEISLFLISSKIIGILPTMLLIVLTSALGAYFARKQGIEAFQKVQRDLQYGKMPGVTIVDGFCILIGGLLLLIPGFLSDIIGALLLIPMTRKQIKPLFERWLRNMSNRNRYTIIR
ncbi:MULTISPECIES: FxsA family protein [Bacillus]|uniref:Exlusion protein FxsA n=1 Tax=Bacillus pumilus (strain SAFR-032) TaxID=315750 RepID=A8FG53_BACP2|nr:MULTISPECIES: FxsA family protein [Bacillus]ABV63220.1 exlusion protein FxsA [Bacillus pumilus SAFR-032]AVI41933.1 membrane protein FxsA [Bacillus pumilus]MBC3643219.1 membrane protein FxsA [Bacillus pumilus]MBC3645668.1 membrane protein FxsA [Bacillus pumilus]MBC3649191.1 membrane protein FxsA [Bacillus pumilus]